MAERGMTTYAEVSRATGIFVTVVSRLAKGETKGIDFDTILRLCLGLRLTPNELFVIDARNEESASTPST